MGKRYMTVVHLNKTTMVKQYGEEIYNSVEKCVRDLLQEVSHVREEIVAMDVEWDYSYMLSDKYKNAKHTRAEALNNIEEAPAMTRNDTKYDVVRFKTDYIKCYEMIWDIVNTLENYLKEDLKLFTDKDDVFNAFILRHVSGYTVSDEDEATCIGDCITTYAVMDNNFAEVDKELYESALPETKEEIDTIMAEYLTYPQSEYNLRNKMTNPKFLVRCIDASDFLEKGDKESFVNIMETIIRNVAGEAYDKYSVKKKLEDSAEFNNTDDRLLVLSLVYNTIRSIYLNINTEVKGYNKLHYRVIVNQEFETGHVQNTYNLYIEEGKQEEIINKLLDRLNDVGKVSIYKVMNNGRDQDRLVKPLVDYIEKV